MKTTGARERNNTDIDIHAQNASRSLQDKTKQTGRNIYDMCIYLYIIIYIFKDEETVGNLVERSKKDGNFGSRAN